MADPIEPTDAMDPMSSAAGADDALQAALQERDENLQRFLRAQADLENARRRWQKESEEQRKYQALPIVRDLLPALDNLRRAVEAAQQSTSIESLRQGVEMVLTQVDDVFNKYEAKPIPALGQPFDPNVHEAISQMPSADQPPMTVLIEAEKGYTMHDRVVRPSKVIVASAAGG
ncbi:MAG: nucleotide exchange factor GrpE [Planctomyces sp.]|nr:nucleotide exchange factor GrpE [Planctomyces sp.]